eukprot:TRINITY_DN2900_c0_g1_i5.p2 TRINITY_DN2900_c0_g1~~TRINITY_DN2900_c0_g1_i5.p2  ORF type:complete len:394 (-),score=122.71 TRINITY_DN2900_c0_g1_i5:124-1305(-)
MKGVIAAMHILILSMSVNSEDANPRVELLVKSYIWPYTDHNIELRAEREREEEKLSRIRAAQIKRQFDTEENAQQARMRQEEEARRLQLLKIQQEKQRKEEEEQRSKLEGRFELMIDNLSGNNTPQEYTLAGLSLNNIRLRLLVNNALANTTLLGLHLARMKIGNDDVAVLCQLLSHNTTLQKLELEGNEIEPKGAAELAEALKTNCTLRFLDLELNPLTKLNKKEVMEAAQEYDNSGIRALSEMLKVNKTLLVLNLARTGIDKSGALYLVEAMKVNSTLISMDLMENSLTVLDTREIKKCLNRNKKAYDDERLREFKERKMMNEEDLANKNLVDIEEKKKEEEEIQKKNRQQRMEERQTKYAKMVRSLLIGSWRNMSCRRTCRQRCSKKWLS